MVWLTEPDSTGGSPVHVFKTGSPIQRGATLKWRARPANEARWDAFELLWNAGTLSACL